MNAESSDAPRTDGLRRSRLAALLTVLGLLLTLAAWLRLGRASSAGPATVTPELAEELGVAYLPERRKEVVSSFSRMVVEERGTVRSLYFVHDDGGRTLESRLDLMRPYDLLIPYTRAMFASYLFRPRPRRVLIVGLGAGSMVRFLQHHEPRLEVDVVEIDPAVIETARLCFGTRGSSNVRIIERDAFDFLRRAGVTYDVIYMDAFLKPGDGNDENGIPLRLKTLGFLRDLQKRVGPDGLVVFNLHDLGDLEVIDAAFERTFVVRFDAPGAVAVATRRNRDLPGATLERRGRALDRRFRASFSFVDLARHVTVHQNTPPQASRPST